MYRPGREVAVIAARSGRGRGKEGSYHWTRGMLSVDEGIKWFSSDESTIPLLSLAAAGQHRGFEDGHSIDKSGRKVDWFG